MSYTQFGSYICFWHVFGNNIFSRIEVTVGCILVYIYAKMLGLYAHLTCCPYELFGMWKPVTYVTYVCSGLCWMVGNSDFIGSIYLWIHSLYIHLKYLAWMSYAKVGIFVSCIYLLITGLVEFAVGCVLLYIWKYVGFICPCSVLPMSAMFGMWQPYLLSNICVQYFLLAYMCIHPVYIHINPYDAQAYFPYEPILPNSNLTVLKQTIHHCQHHFNRVHLYYVYSLEYCQ